MLEEVLEASLSRVKNSLSGELVFSVFINEALKSKILEQIDIGRPVTAYVNGRLAFFGNITRRSRYSLGSGYHRRINSNNESSPSNHHKRLTSTGYSLRITSRGKGHLCYKSSQMTYGGYPQHITAKDIITSLLKPFSIEIEWEAHNVQLPFFTFRDGSLVSEEIYRVCNENGYYLHESRAGKIVISDSPKDERGEDLILGKNIVSFEEYVDDSRSNSHLIVKGHKNSKYDWGKKKIKDAAIVLSDTTVRGYSPYVVQHYGYVDEESLKRRAKWELEQRKYLGHNLFITVFGLRNDKFFDLGLKHFVSIPILGINQVLECIEINYTLTNSSATTQLVLAPFANKKTHIPKNGGVVDGKGEVKRKRHQTDLKIADFDNIFWDKNEKGNVYFYPSNLDIPDQNLEVAAVQEQYVTSTNLYKALNLAKMSENEEEEPEEYLNGVYERQK